ncbi:helix-turn-helix transcriptional regulator [Jeotgalibaca sp. MA1X17-3]|uniref:helix-turn-helix transcriptional regulator n=1 Tax=Jeotgalibaca sp. MA1X17-3 TaxID=2908211 RepID=UPI001F1B14A6|nr:helix-turn-helix transcriptional regulator [Jeotgalibaca sp. MA1X17-3]UJF15660.1 helix-turn-helix transcriptional regulator [Jeotgalibaca sp. MA1X17-3]
MQEHYCDSDLSLVKLAQEIHVSAPYLSNLFKVEKNVNFTEYLLQLRMEQAKKLLKNTEKKTYEIAEEIGFLNSHYFSSCFKKYTGQTALSFRKE